MIAIKKVHAWLADTDDPSPIEYWHGLLSRDRFKDASPLPERERKELNLLAAEIWRLYEIGQIRLIQRRVSPNVCAYIARKMT